MKGLTKQVFDAESDPMSWMREEENALAHQDRIRATTKIILHLIDFMEKHQMSQTDLAQKPGVTPQYINKLLHGQDTSFRIDTAILKERSWVSSWLKFQILSLPPYGRCSTFQMSCARLYPAGFLHSF